MNKILEKNLMSLPKEDKYIKPFFENKKLNRDKLNVIEQDVKVGVEDIGERKVLYLLKGEKQYQLDSLYNSEQLLDKWFGQFDNANYRSRYLLFGLGNGMYARKLLRESGEQSVIVIVEPSKEVFETVMQHFDITDLLINPRVILLIDGITEERFIDVLNIVLDQEDLPGAVCRAYLNYPQIFSEQFEKYDDTIRRHTNRLEANRTVMFRYAGYYRLNSFLNYPYMLKQKSLIALSRELPKDIPAIVVAAGPSLDKNAEILKKAKNRAFILAVDSAARALVRKGIIPDAMICIDAMKSYKHFVDPEIQHIPMITNLFSSWIPLQLHKGDKYFLHDNNAYIGEYFEKINKILPQVAGGGSVATDAYALLERMEFNTIILVGLDLAYTNEKSHSEDSVRGEENFLLENKKLEIEDIYRNKIKTSYEFQIYFDWFAEEIRNNAKIHAIDSTEGGAKIPGTTIITLQEAIETYCKREINISDIMRKIPYRLTQAEQDGLKEHIYQIPERTEILIEKIEEVLELYKKIYKKLRGKRYSRNEIVKTMNRAKEMGSEIEAEPVFFYTQLRMAAIEEMREDLFAVKEGESEAETAVKQAIKYFEKMREAANNNVWGSKVWIDVAESKKIPEGIISEEARACLEGKI